MTNGFTPIRRQRQIPPASAIVLALLTATLAPLSIAARAHATGGTAVKLDSTMFAAQVGSTTDGGSVYAGALPDRRLGDGAIVFTTTGRTTQRVTFQEFFALGSVKGRGSITVTPRSGGRATFSGRLAITRGTGSYRHANGALTAHGSISKTGMVKATLKGSFSG